MIVEVGEYFKKELDWELENCMTQVRCKWKERYGNTIAHFRWSEPVESFGPLRVLVGPPSLASVSWMPLSWTVRKRF